MGWQNLFCGVEPLPEWLKVLTLAEKTKMLMLFKP
jgi:hypothetical protein